MSIQQPCTQFSQAPFPFQQQANLELDPIAQEHQNHTHVNENHSCKRQTWRAGSTAAMNELAGTFFSAAYTFLTIFCTVESCKQRGQAWDNRTDEIVTRQKTRPTVFLSARPTNSLRRNSRHWLYRKTCGRCDSSSSRQKKTHTIRAGSRARQARNNNSSEGVAFVARAKS